MPNIADRNRPGFDIDAQTRQRGETIWQGDDLDREKEAVSQPEAFGALLALGYAHFNGRPILPHTFIDVATEELQQYNVARSLKDPIDAGEAFKCADTSVHIDFMRSELLQLAEDLHERGVDIAKLAVYARGEMPYLAHIAKLVGSRSEAGIAQTVEELFKDIWAEILRRSEEALRYEN